MPYVSDQGGTITVGYKVGLASPGPEVDQIIFLRQNQLYVQGPSGVPKSIYICEHMGAKRPKYRWSLTYKVPTSEFLSL